MNRIVACIALSCLSCGDPVTDGRIADLGPEQDAFPPSDIHRPGQPCVLCHSDYEKAEPRLSIGGTLFLEPVAGEPLQPVSGYTIRLNDSASQIVNLITNRCGNFFITEEEFAPTYPMRAELFGPSLTDLDNLVQITVMSTRIGRDGSCASCHNHPASVFSPGVVFLPAALLNPDIELPDPATCPVPVFPPQL